MNLQCTFRMSKSPRNTSYLNYWLPGNIAKLYRQNCPGGQKLGGSQLPVTTVHVVYVYVPFLNVKNDNGRLWHEGGRPSDKHLEYPVCPNRSSLGPIIARTKLNKMQCSRCFISKSLSSDSYDRSHLDKLRWSPALAAHNALLRISQLDDSCGSVGHWLLNPTI